MHIHKIRIAPSLNLVLQFGWALWFTFVVLNNITDLLTLSENFLLIQNTTSIYNLPFSINLIFFILIIILELIITFVFWHSCLSLLKKSNLEKFYINLSYALSLSLWFLFLVADEIFRNYSLAPTHLRLLSAHLLSLLVITSFQKKI